MREDKSGVLYLNGKPFNFTDVSFDSPIGAKDLIGTLPQSRCCSFTGTLKYPKMSRKKFVGYLRKRGYSKKRAKQIAWYYNRKRTSYGSAYMAVLFGGNPYLESHV